MSDFIVFDTFLRNAIPSVSFWRVENSTVSTILGSTDATGRYVGVSLAGENFRTYAEGYRSDDYVDYADNLEQIGLARIHPGFYSGYFPEKNQALWYSQETDEYLLFRASGFGDRPIDPNTPSNEGFFQFNAPEQSSGWVNCIIRNSNFPITPSTPARLIDPYHDFLFPTQGVMKARRATDGGIVDFEIYN